jgi:hypothetical protein
MHSSSSSLMMGKNTAILHLQMIFRCWDIVIKHQNDVCLTDANHFSSLGADLCFDLLLKEYAQQVDAIRRCSPALAGLPIAPMNQPYFYRPHLTMLCKLEKHPSAPQPPDSGALAAMTITGLQQQIPNAMSHLAAFIIWTSPALLVCLPILIGPSTALTVDTSCLLYTCTVHPSKWF